LSEPATYPELPSLSIVSARLPWAITAHASGREVRYLTVGDVLNAIFDALRLHVDEEHFSDWAVIPQSGPHRPRNALKSSGITYRNGMTRLDLLEETTFAGLFPSAMGCDIWVLEV
ncbi:hypothetical protein C8R43DRAFT_823510, partial [Mycena crocata]